ncbi:MAG TPA: hemolysin III family protein [Ignavibacteriales bacterium]|nr:hemolysin III family protein [Ignavibacteriales bacterium]
MKKNNTLALSRMREPVNGLTHLAAAFLSVIGWIILLALNSGSLVKALYLTVYGASLVFMFTSSAIYHLANLPPESIKKLRKLDHSAIFVLIAGSYTPICIHFFTGFWQWGLLTLAWLVAITGVTIKLVTMNAPRWISTAMYLAMGWMSVIAIGEIISAMPAGALVWFFLGGFFYTFGAVIYALKKPDLFPGKFGFHEVWHIFVILGAFCHYIVIAVYIAPVI